MSSNAPGSPTPVVELRGVGKVYEPSPVLLRLLVRSPIRRRVVALRDVDLTVAPGEICAIVGPNGAGKTTMFRILAGLTLQTEGVARVLGSDLRTHSRDVRGNLGWMPANERSLFQRLTCWENLYFHGRLQAMSRSELEEAIPRILAEVGIPHVADHAVFALSAGMKARLQVARALIHRPKLLLLDEPTGSVDPVGAHDLIETVRELVRRHDIAALISSHRLEEIQALRSRVVLLDDGRIVYDGDLEALRGRWELQRIELTFTDAASAAAARERLVDMRSEFQLDGTLLSGLLEGGERAGTVFSRLGDLTAGITRVEEDTMPLRDLLARVYSADARDDGEAAS